MTARTLTRTEWDELHDDYKLVRDGAPYMLSLERDGATCLIRVEIASEAWVCEDCYFAHHYGQPDGPCDREPLALLDGLDISDNTDSNTGDGITTFSWSPCDGCGSTLGGARYRLAYFVAATGSEA